MLRFDMHAFSHAFSQNTAKSRFVEVVAPTMRVATPSRFAGGSQVVAT
jgi:hypothetical protein